MARRGPLVQTVIQSGVRTSRLLGGNSVAPLLLLLIALAAAGKSAASSAALASPLSAPIGSQSRPLCSMYSPSSACFYQPCSPSPPRVRALQRLSVAFPAAPAREPLALLRSTSSSVPTASTPKVSTTYPPSKKRFRRRGWRPAPGSRPPTCYGSLTGAGCSPPSSAAVRRSVGPHPFSFHELSMPLASVLSPPAPFEPAAYEPQLARLWRLRRSFNVPVPRPAASANAGLGSKSHQTKSNQSKGPDQRSPHPSHVGGPISTLKKMVHFILPNRQKAALQKKYLCHAGLSDEMYVQLNKDRTLRTYPTDRTVGWWNVKAKLFSGWLEMEEPISADYCPTTFRGFWLSLPRRSSAIVSHASFLLARMIPSVGRFCLTSRWVPQAWAARIASRFPYLVYYQRPIPQEEVQPGSPPMLGDTDRYLLVYQLAVRPGRYISSALHLDRQGKIYLLSPPFLLPWKRKLVGTFKLEPVVLPLVVKCNTGTHIQESYNI
eukprot:GHVT01095692.1.p1 GENE.GHVT01095692.1~~GHVT01095692.1.p1  ORF type:complete len:491 (-),score=35.84 GHVT01095692.1:931-2403(-)